MSRLPEIATPQRKPYPGDLSDAEWQLLKPLLPSPKGFGHSRAVDFREILNAIFYVQRTGCQWEMLPISFADGVARLLEELRREFEWIRHCRDQLLKSNTI